MARGQSPYQGAYGFPVQSTVEQSMARGAQAQAQMYSNLGRELGNVANAYFESKAEDNQIEAIANDPRILDMVYKGRADMPADPKQRKKDIKALWREMGGRKGIEQLIRMDEADARNKELFDLQKQAHLREKDKYERELEHERVKLQVLQDVYFPKAEVTREVEDPRLEAVAEGLEGKNLGDLLGLKESVQDGVETIHSLRSELSKQRPEVMPEVLRNLRTSIIDHPEWSEDHKQTLLEALVVSPDNPYGSKEVAKALEAENVHLQVEAKEDPWLSQKPPDPRLEAVAEREGEELPPASRQFYGNFFPLPKIDSYDPASLYNVLNTIDNIYPDNPERAAEEKQKHFARLWEFLPQVEATEEQKESARSSLQEVLHPPEKEESYVAGMLGAPFRGLEEGLASARRSLAEVTLPEKLEVPTTTVTTTERQLSPNLATTKEGMWAMIKANNPDMPAEYLPHLIKLVQDSGKPTVAQVGYSGLRSLAAENKEYFWSAQEAEDWLRTTGKSKGVVIGQANVDDFREKARIMDAEKINKEMTNSLKTRRIYAADEKMEALREAKHVITGAKTKAALVGPASDSFARIFQPGGILTDDDIMRLGGQSQGLIDKLRADFKLLEDGTLDETQANEMLKIIETMTKSQKADLEKYIPQIATDFANRYEITKDDVFKKTQLSKYMKFVPRSVLGTSAEFDAKAKNVIKGSTFEDPRYGTGEVTEIFDDGRFIMETSKGSYLVDPKTQLGDLPPPKKKSDRDVGEGEEDSPPETEETSFEERLETRGYGGDENGEGESDLLTKEEVTMLEEPIPSWLSQKVFTLDPEESILAWATQYRKARQLAELFR